MRSPTTFPLVLFNSFWISLKVCHIYQQLEKLRCKGQIAMDTVINTWQSLTHHPQSTTLITSQSLSTVTQQTGITTRKQIISRKDDTSRQTHRIVRV